VGLYTTSPSIWPVQILRLSTSFRRFNQWRQNTPLTHIYTYTYFISSRVHLLISFILFIFYRQTTLHSRPSAHSSQHASSHLSPGHSFSPPSLLPSTLLRTFLIHRHVTISSCIPPGSLPKKGLPLLEIAVALVASILGGFGTVAMFCTVGVYV
jgi:hypothetical protein